MAKGAHRAPATEAPPKAGRAGASRKTGTLHRLRDLWRVRGVKIALVTGGLLFLLPALFVLGIVLGINPIVKLGVQKLGSSALKVPVDLRRASISFAGRASLGGFRVANPEGFTRPEAVSFESLYAHVPIPAAFRQNIDIAELTIVHPEFSFELEGKHRPSNWAVLMKNLSQSLPKKDQPEPPGRETTFNIGTLRLVGPVVHFYAPSIPRGITLHLKDIVLEKVGTGPGAHSKTYLILSAAFQALLTGGLKEGKDLPSDVRGPLSKELSEATATFKAALKPSP